jgi:predicted nucleotidyltransferase
MTDFGALLQCLHDREVDFILVGGVAAVAHGSARLTQDVDVVYSRTRENIDRLARSLAEHDPYLRGAPPGLPFTWDTATINRGLNFTLTTNLGDIDLFGEIPGGGRYEDLVDHCITLELFGTPCRCLGLEWLIRVKRAAGRPKDLEAVAELEVLLEERARGEA